MTSKFNELILKLTGYDFGNGRSKRQLFEGLSEIGVAISVVVILWKLLITITNCSSPIVVVVSGSMEPAYYRGDLLFVTHHDDEPINVGDVIIFSVKTHPNNLVHRVIKMHQNKENPSKIKILTKGDNNAYDDSTGLYARGQKWLTKKHIHGKVKGYLPYIGYLTIMLTEFRPVVIAVAGFVFILVSRKKDEKKGTQIPTEESKEENESLQ